MKDKRVEIYIPNKEEWKAITKLEYNEGTLRVKEIDYKWDSQKGYFFGTKNDEEYVLVQASKSAKIKKLFIDASELLVKGKSEKRIEKKEAKLLRVRRCVENIFLSQQLKIKGTLEQKFNFQKLQTLERTCPEQIWNNQQN